MGYIRSNYKKMIATILVIAMFTTLFMTQAFVSVEGYGDVSSVQGVQSAAREGSYAYYLQVHAGVPSGTTEIVVDIFNYSSAQDASVLTNFEGEARVLRTEETGYIEYIINVPQAGMFNFYIQHFPLEARGIDIERKLTINGEVPFMGADIIVFQRVWGDSDIGVRVDNRGNEIRPPQVERPRWESSFFRDRMGYFTEPYKFFLQSGENVIRLTGVNEPLAIRKFAIKPVLEIQTYQEFIQNLDTSRFTNQNTEFLQLIQGEHSTNRSSPSLFALFDSSSGTTYPASASLIRLNMIGGHPWRMPRQWIEWEFYAPEAGLYRISLSVRQNHNRGFVSSRSLTLNGETPFQEVSAVPFHFNNRWSLETLQDDQGNDLLFEMEQGINTIRLEVTLGDLGEILDRILGSVYRLNNVYRSILVLTGPNPDTLRDYRIDVLLPHVMYQIEEESRILMQIVDDLTTFAGERNEHTAMALTIARQLELFTNRPDRIPVQLVNFRQNISALGDSARALAESPLDIDFLIISGADAELPVVRETFLQTVMHELRSFFASFFMDFDSLGDVHEGDNVIEIWIPAGRDQSIVLKSMIDDTFTPNTGIGVNLRLVAPEAVLPAVVAGINPDAVLSVPLPDPVNYALRGAAVDLTQFPDFDYVTSWFADSAMIPFTFEGGIYALPETQNFSLMFYRRDIFEELGLEPPQTWTDVIRIMPTIQRNNMNIGIPSVADPGAPDLGGFLTQLYQRGGFLYNELGSRTLLDSEEAIAAFEAYIRFFTHHGTPTVFNFINRFRSGEMPIGFADFTSFNTLAVFAPEIQGLWGFGLMPGVMQEDGTINRSVPAWGTASVMFDNSDMHDQTWEFLKWWVSADTQLRFGRELESVMGAAARYPTANLEAFSRLPWGAAEMQVLTTQREWTVGTPEVPGGYYVSRHLINASRRVINQNVDVRETLLDFAIVINRELINKRREFGLEY